MNRKAIILIALLCCAVLPWVLAGCAKKKVDNHETELEQEALRLRQLEDAWMRGGRYWADNISLQEKVLKAVDNFEKLTAYEIGLYSDDYRTLMEFDGQIYGQDCYFQYHENKREPAWVFYVIKGRFYALNTAGDSLVDYGANSADRGYNFYRPILSDIRVAVKQTVKGEIRDVGMITYLEKPVHRYDMRTLIPDLQHTMLTATIDVDEKLGTMIHAVIGQGIDSESSRTRFEKLFQELVVDKVGNLEPISLPKEVEIIPQEREELDWRKPGLH